MCAKPLSDQQRSELVTLLDDDAGGALGVSALLIGEPGPPLIDVGTSPASWDGLSFTPQLVDETIRNGIVALLAASQGRRTEPAWWWASTNPDEPTAAISYLHPRDTTAVPRRAAAHNPGAPSQEAYMTDSPSPPSGPGQPEIAASDPLAATGPMINLLGPVELTGATGAIPTRAQRQCVEYAAWLLEHPGATGQQMAAGLLVAEGTRRSNMSRLRLWLGDDSTGIPYLPDAYSGRIRLHDDVGSDWLRLRGLLSNGVNRCGDGALQAALQLVRGAPLADAAPGQWSWAEEMRIDMCSMIRDTGLVLAERALAAGNLDLAHWATRQALLAAPDDELLLCLQLRADHAAGNHLDAERLAMRMTRQARSLGVDLAESTVTTIQLVLEGRPRRRA